MKKLFKEVPFPYTEKEVGKKFVGLKKGYKKSKKIKSLLRALP